jgi:hypothetical protein
VNGADACVECPAMLDLDGCMSSTSELNYSFVIRKVSKSCDVYMCN